MEKESKYKLIVVGIMVTAFFLLSALAMPGAKNELESIESKIRSLVDLSKEESVAVVSPVQAKEKAAESTSTPPAPVSKAPKQKAFSVSSVLPSVVFVTCPQKNGDVSEGSGLITRTKSGDTTGVFTNAHVVGDAETCIIGVNENARMNDRTGYLASVVNISTKGDLAILKFGWIYDPSTDDYRAMTETDEAQLVSKPARCAEGAPKVGDKLFVIGYPVNGGYTVTVTEGILSGYSDDGNYYKTSAKIDHGNSGGLAVMESGCALGMPTIVMGGELESLGYILKVENLL